MIAILLKMRHRATMSKNQIVICIFFVMFDFAEVFLLLLSLLLHLYRLFNYVTACAVK